MENEERNSEKHKNSNDRPIKNKTEDISEKPDPVVNDDAPRTTGKYTISDILGKGAMGVVYKGFDPHIERIVAIKRIRKENLQDQDLDTVLERFRREAKAAGKLHHPNIVTVHEYGEDNQDAYIVMEFVEGLDLRQYLKQKKRLPVDEAVRIMKKLLSALEYSHGQGVVHRDIKPGNVFILENGEIKLSDFGIAKFEETNLTRTGMVIGTPSYMSPEQIKGHKIDSRSDLFSAGVILYEMLTGVRPFMGERVITIMNNVLKSSFEDPCTVNPDIPKPFGDVIQKALAREPHDRFQSAGEFAKSLSRALDHVPTVETEKPSAAALTAARPPSRRGPWLALVLVLLTVGLTSAGIWIWSASEDTGRQPAQPPTTEEIASPETQKAAVTSEADAQKTLPGQSPAQGKEPMGGTESSQTQQAGVSDRESLSEGEPTSDMADSGTVSRNKQESDTAGAGDDTRETTSSEDTKLEEDQAPKLADSPEESEQAGESDKTVMVNSDPEGAQVYVNGELYGKTPLTFFVGAGEHRLEIKKDGFSQVEDTLLVPSDETQPMEYEANLEPSPEILAPGQIEQGESEGQEEKSGLGRGFE